MITREDFWAKSNGQSVEQHTKELLNLFDDFCNKYGDKFDDKTKLLIILASKYHDLGKINSSFQYYIHKQINVNVDKFKKGLCHYSNIKSKDIPHGILSGAFISKKKLLAQGLDLEDYKVVVSSVINQHIRSLKNEDGDDTIIEIVNTDLALMAEKYGLNYCNAIPIIKHNFFKRQTEFNFEEQLWLKYATVKGMLNKLDYAASAGEQQIEISPENAYALSKQAMLNKGFSLRPCQQYMEDKGEKNIIMTASTGMGKTEAAMIWARADKTF